MSWQGLEIDKLVPKVARMHDYTVDSWRHAAPGLVDMSDGRPDGPEIHLERTLFCGGVAMRP